MQVIHYYNYNIIVNKCDIDLALLISSLCAAETVESMGTVIQLIQMVFSKNRTYVKIIWKISR